MEEAFLPEEIIVFILTLLPVKSLIRFTCVSKRFHFIILSDPKFAKSQLKAAHEHKTLNHNLLLCTKPPDKLCKLSTFRDDPYPSVRKLTFPFEPPIVETSAYYAVSMLGSSNGIVFLAFNRSIFYIWNPSTRFFRKLPDLGLLLNKNKHAHELVRYGVGYLPNSDDYKLFVYSKDYVGGTGEAAVLSLKSKAWKRLQVSTDASIRGVGTYLNEALHWLNRDGVIMVFDLADEEREEEEEEEKFREMFPPSLKDDVGVDTHFTYLGVSAGGLLSISRVSKTAPDCILVWIMNVYGVRGSWTKLLNVKVSVPYGFGYLRYDDYYCVWIREDSTVAIISNGIYEELIRIDHKEEEKQDRYTIDFFWLLIQYQETLIRMDD